MAAFRTLIVLACAWQAIVWLAAPPRYILPAPLDVAGTVLARRAYLLDNALVTLGEIALGLTAGITLGIATAIAVTLLPRLGRLVWPIVLVVQAFPVFVLAPVLVLWFGFGMASKVVMTTLIIFFPVASAFADGLRRTPGDLIDAARLTPASRWREFADIRIPLAMPSLVSGLRVAAPLAPLGAVIGEWVGASAGLGFVMVQANARMQTETMFAAMAIVALFALVLRRAVDLIEPWLMPWAAPAQPDRSFQPRPYS